MASITNRGATFQVEVRRKGYPSISKCFKTARAAKAWAAEQEALLEASRSPLRVIRERFIPTLADALARYVSEVTPAKKSAAKEVSFLKFWSSTPLSKARLTQISAQDIGQQRDQMLKLGRSPATVVRYLAVLSHVFTVSRLDWGYPVANPVDEVRKPKVSNARSRRPSAAEFDALLKQTNNSELALFFRLAIETAMRRSELFNLRWENLDLAKQFVHLLDTKNGSQRVVIISEVAVEAFRQIGLKPQGRVFSFHHVDTPSKAFRKACLAARQAYVRECEIRQVEPSSGFLDNLKLHDLRHEATSSLFERGLTIPEVSSITGHKTLSMLSRYTHLRPESVLDRLNMAGDSKR